MRCGFRSDKPVGIKLNGVELNVNNVCSNWRPSFVFQEIAMPNGGYRCGGRQEIPIVIFGDWEVSGDEAVLEWKNERWIFSNPQRIYNLLVYSGVRYEQVSNI